MALRSDEVTCRSRGACEVVDPAISSRCPLSKFEHVPLKGAAAVNRPRFHQLLSLLK